MNPITILLLGGVALLLINIIYGIVRARRGQVKAGWLTVSLALVACALIGIGTVARTANPAAAFGFPTGGNRGNRPANVTGASQGSSDASTQGLRNVAQQGSSGALQQDGQGNGASGTAVAADPQSDSAATNQSPSADATPVRGNRRGNRGANGSGAGNGSAYGNAGANATGIAPQGDASSTSGTTDPAATPSGNRRFRQGGQNTGANGAASAATPAANDSAAATPGSDTGSGFNQGAAGNGAGNNAGTAFDPNNLPLSVQINRFVPQIAVGGAVIGIILAWILYQMEKKRAGFTASSSRGLLNAGAGVFMLVAALVIPLIPAEFASASSGQPARAFARAAAVTRVAVTATPSPTPLPTATATPLPTLTPETTQMPIVMPTEITYAAMQPTATATVVPDCTITATNNLNLRADPSTNNASLGKAPIPTGTVLPVIGKSKDGKWWQVTYNDGMVDWTGWVSTTFTKAGSKCSAVSVTQ